MKVPWENTFFFCFYWTMCISQFMRKNDKPSETDSFQWCLSSSLLLSSISCCCGRCAKWLWRSTLPSPHPSPPTSLWHPQTLHGLTHIADFRNYVFCFCFQNCFVQTEYSFLSLCERSSSLTSPSFAWFQNTFQLHLNICNNCNGSNLNSFYWW